MPRETETRTNALLSAQVGRDCAQVGKHFYKPAPVRTRSRASMQPAARPGLVRGMFAAVAAVCGAAFLIL